MHLLRVSKVHTYLGLRLPLHEHAIGLHHDLIDAALDQVWLRGNHLRLLTSIVHGLEVLNLFELLELTE